MEREIDFTTMTVLVIDDDSMIRDLFRSALEELGVRKVLTAEDGQKALTKTEQGIPDIVLCDVHMETLDGPGYVRTLRGSESKRIRDLPVIMMSYDGKRETVLASAEAGIQGYIKKPCSIEMIRDRITAVMRDHLGPPQLKPRPEA